MSKKFSKILAILLTLGMIATFCTVPMTASADAPAGETYDDYDVIEYADLLDTGNNHLTASGVTLTAQNNLFHYDATSASHSVIYKFRYVAGASIYFQLFPGAYRSGDPFAYRINNATTWQKRYSTNAGSVTVDTITEGTEIDIELARLQVKTGDNAGKYYTYLKANGTRLFEAYIASSDISGTDLDDSIQLNLNGSNSCMIKATPAAPAEQEPADALYYYYDEIDYNDLLENGNPLATETQMGSKTFTYNRTAATYSAILKYRWKAINTAQFQISFDKAGSGVDYMFGAQLYTPGAEGHTTSSIRLRPGLDNAAWNNIGYNIETGAYYDIEFARLKVKNGANAGKYYVYFKMNDVMISESYVAANVVDANGNYTSNPGSASCTLSNEIYLTFWGGGGADKIMHTPVPDTYDDFDEVAFSDLYQSGTQVGGTVKDGSGNYTYTATSASYSTKFSFRWTAATEADKKFTVYFDDWKYPFCFAVKTPNQSGFGATAGPNGSWHLVPSNDSMIVDMEEPIVGGQDYDIEVGRLKVVAGDNEGKYYVYFKVNNELIKSYYYDGVSNGTYSSGTALSNNIIVSAPAGNKFKAIPVPETYDDYDEVYYSNLKVNGNAVPAERSGSGTTYTYNKTSASGSAILKLRWKAANAATQFQMSFDRRGNNDAVNYMFGMQLYTPDSEHPNGRVWLRPGYGPSVDLVNPIVTGTNYDIEFARLKVKTGINKGKYYMYFKMNDVLIAEDYVAANVVDASGNYTSNPGSTACSVSNEMYITFWGGGGATITNPAYTETYDEYDEVSYYDMKIGGNSLPEAGLDLGTNRTITYDVTSPSHSAVLKFRWTAGPTARFLLYFDAWAGSAYPFCLAVKNPGHSSLGAAAGANGAWHVDPSVDSHIVQMTSPIAEGDVFDIEFARLKVLDGPHKGTYYVYLKVDGNLIYGYYYDGVAADGSTYKNETGTFTNEIRLNSSETGNVISAIPVPETYEAYDEIGYGDLTSDGNALPTGGMGLTGATVFNYNPTSPTGSAIFKYNWKVGSVQKFQMSFEKTSASAMAYQFGAWLSEPGADEGFSNGRMWLVPGSGPQVDMPSVLESGTYHNVEFARLKVKTGAPSNIGKYRVYIKIDDTLIAEAYVAANVVDENGDYYTNPKTNDLPTLCNVHTGEIIFAFWGSEGNAIAPYKATFTGQEGVTADFDGDGILNAAELTGMTQALLGVTNLAELPTGIADFNKDGAANILDLIALKKFLAPVNTYVKSGNLALGMQEHLLESNGTFVDNTKTAAYIADATATMGASVYRLSRPIHALFYVNSANGVTVDTDEMAQFKAMVAALKAQGINNILYVTDSFMLPYGYSNPAINHNKTVPTPGTTDYEHWLTVNANAFAALATEVPEIKFFEPFNEINLTTTGLEKPGIPWDASSEVAANYKYTVAEKAGIMADLCWYVSRAVKGVDAANQVTTPSVSVGSHESIIEGTYLNALYTAIDSGSYPSFQTVGDKRADNYFTIVNIHTYPEFATTSSARTTKVNNIANDIYNTIYSVMQAHNDGGTRVWLTETGVSTFGSRSESNAADLIKKFLTKIDTNLTYIDTVVFYKIANASTSNGLSEPETKFGLFYSGDASSNRYAAKQTGKAVYSYFHNNTTDYSALTALAARYA